MVAIGCGGASSGPSEAKIPPSVLAIEPPAPASASPVPDGPASSGRPVVSASFMNRSGGYWGSVMEPNPDIASLGRICYESELRSNPRLQGWLYVDVDLTASSAALAESSPLPRTLTDCIVRKVTLLSAPDGFTIGPATVYFSLQLVPP